MSVDNILKVLQGEPVLDDELMADLLISSKDARRHILEDLHGSIDVTDRRLYQAVMNLSKDKGDIESLAFSIQIIKPEPVPEPEPSIGELLHALYGRK